MTTVIIYSIIPLSQSKQRITVHSRPTVAMYISLWDEIQRSGGEGSWPEPSVTVREGKGCKGKCTEEKILTI